MNEWITFRFWVLESVVSKMDERVPIAYDTNVMPAMIYNDANTCSVFV